MPVVVIPSSGVLSVTEIVDGVRVGGSGAILAAEETDALGDAAVNGSRTK